MQGTWLEYTVPMTLKLNGLAERMNGTIMEGVQSILLHAKLPKMFWAKALMTTTYVINRSPLVLLNDHIPQRVWSRQNISYQHLRVFEYLTYVHVAKD